MTNTLNQEMVNTIITSLENAVSSIKTNLANIDEEYKKLAAAAKAELEDTLKNTNDQLIYWHTLRDDAPVPEKKRRTKKVETVEEKPVIEEPVVSTEEATEPEQVVDTLFPENNDPEENSEEQITKDASSEFDGIDFMEADKEASQDEQTDITEVSENSESTFEDEWPDMPEEWK